MASVAICSASSSIGPETTLRDFFNRVYCCLKLSGKSANTKRLYDVTLRNFDSYLGRSATLADLNDDTVTVHIGWYTDRGRSPRTGNKARDQLLAIWRFAARKRFVNEWPDVEPLPEYKRTPTAWTPEQFSRLVAVASSSAMVRSGRINYPRAPHRRHSNDCMVASAVAHNLRHRNPDRRRNAIAMLRLQRGNEALARSSQDAKNPRGPRFHPQ